jgi:hypothetical protein
MSTSRQTVRDKLAELLDTDLVSGSPQLAFDVIGHKVTDQDLEAGDPIVAVLSSGTIRERMTMQGDRPDFYLDIQVWVRSASTARTVAQTEDILDEIEARIAQVFQDNRSGPNSPTEWAVLEYAARSTIGEIETAKGVAYSLEVYPVRARLARA